MIVFAAIVPHSPLLIPSIGKEHREKLAATVAAFEKIEQLLYVAQPDCIAIIAPHGARYPEAFSANLASKYTGTLKAFGDFSTTIEAKSDTLMIDRVQRKLRAEGVPFTLSSNEELDYGYTVPLLMLTSKLPKRKIVPFSPSNLNGATHMDFGRQLKRVLHAEDERVAFIASGDLSHHVNAASPSGASPEGKAFDEHLRAAIDGHDGKMLANLDPKIITGAGQCAYAPVMTLLGLLEDMNLRRNVLSYEAPFGVGCLTATYEIS